MAEALPRHVIRTGALKAEDAMRIRHPLNPQSDVTIHALSRRAGMKRAHLNLGRIPPGKESFIPHAHAQQEEFICRVTFFDEASAETKSITEWVAKKD